jgi:hypothetical protein
MTTKSWSTVIVIPDDTTKGFQGSSCATSSVTVIGNKTLQHSRTGQANLGWRAQVQAGQNAATPFSASHQLMLYNPASGRVDYTTHCAGCRTGPLSTVFDQQTGTRNIMTLGLIGSHFGGGTDACASSRATSNLYKKLRNAHHQFQGGVFVGEFTKTLKMFAGAAGGLRKGVLGFLSYWKGNSPTKSKKRNRSLSKSIADHWLETVFGWQPLINDVKDAAIALARLQHEVPAVRFRVNALCEEQTLHTVTKSNSGLFGWYLQTTRSVKTEQIYYGAYRASLPANDPLQRVISLSGFDLRSLIPTVWELVPWSFLVDYFVNIGEVLEAYTTDTSIVAWVVSVSRKESKEIQTLTIDPGSHNAYTSAFCQEQGLKTSGTPGRFEVKLQTINRQPLAQVPLLMPRLKISNISGKQFVNMGALIISRR